MQVALANRERQSMIFLGDPLDFTYDTPGPREVDLDSLTPTQKNQLLYNCRLGILAVDDKEALLQACSGAPAASQSFTTAHEQPLGQEPPKDAVDGRKSDLEALKLLLDAHHSTVKKNVRNLRPAQVRDLLELEQKGKKRKTILKFLNEVVGKHTSSVSEDLGPIDLAELDGAYAAAPGRRSTQITEVEDSEIQEITLIPSDEELKVEDD